MGTLPGIQKSSLLHCTAFRLVSQRIVIYLLFLYTGGGGTGAQVVNFMFVPSHMTIPFVCGVSFGWTTVLSVMQSAYDQLHEQETVLVSGQLDQAIASPIPPAEGRVLFAGRTGTAAAMTPQRGVGLQEIARAKDGENV